jgi:alpha-D-xyloside xylohydrolase
MKQQDRMIFDFLDLDQPERQNETVWQALRPEKAMEREDGSVQVTVPFTSFAQGSFKRGDSNCSKKMLIRRYGEKILRMTIGDCPPDQSNPMLQMSDAVKQRPLKLIDNSKQQSAADYELIDDQGKTVMTMGHVLPQQHVWSDLIVPALDEFTMTAWPQTSSEVAWSSYDTFTPEHRESIGLGFTENDQGISRWLYAHHAKPDEHFAGTGERFAPLDLKGKTLILENTDALGVNSRRAYKNVPLYISSEGYGVLVMTSAHVRLSMADISTRAVQGQIEDDYLDIFLLGGEDIADILLQYRLLTGFPEQMPLWSYGMWMSRMTYFSAEETMEIARRLRDEDYPCDVLHLDTGWFRKDWQCEWAFNPVTFPDPPAYFREMKDLGYRITLWQNPSVAKDTLHYETAVSNRYLAPIAKQENSESDFGGASYGGNIDFSNPKAVTWYQGLLRDLLEMGAAAIKTDFGEKINANAVYYGLPYKRLHNLYALLYQKAAYEVTKEVTGDGIIWARAGWIGCQRYPIHWGGDCACSWDGLAGTIRGGLHIGLSGFSFWSHDIPGFHSLPEFMNNRPSDNLYLRWTQAAVFGSHMRYHGTSAREPYEYPAVADLTRGWLKLRYALIPYIYKQGQKSVEGGLPLMRALIFHHQDDPVCWHVDHGFYCGDDLLIYPVMNDEGTCRPYLPAGSWVDFWTGERLEGGRYLPLTQYPLGRIPIFVRAGAQIEVYPEQVSCTDDMDLAQAVTLSFGADYNGFANSPLQAITGLE